MKPEKYIKDGKVAILISPDFGAGWSTWAHRFNGPFLLFDKQLIKFAEADASSDVVKAYLHNKGITEQYVGGWGDICVRWLPEGTKFTVEEYDGSESIRTILDLEYTA